MTAVLSRELPLAVAKGQASSSQVVALLSPAYVEDLATFVETSVRQGASQGALVLAELLASAAVAGRDAPVPAPDAAAQAARAVLAYIDVAHVYLIDVPDGRLFRRALQLGGDEEQIARAAKDTRLLGGLLHRLGTMHLDPYGAGRSLTPGDTPSQGRPINGGIDLTMVVKAPKGASGQGVVTFGATIECKDGLLRRSHEVLWAGESVAFDLS